MLKLTSNKVILFEKRYCWIRDQRLSVERATVAGELQGSSKVNLWHQRLAHVNINQLRELMGNAKGVDIPLRKTEEFR